MNWRIELVEADGEMPIVTVLQAHRIWKRLSKAAREAVVGAYPEEVVDAHTNTMTALYRHGFIEEGNNCWFLTDAARAVARWNVQP